MAKFHINKHGTPAPCEAEDGACPLGGAHFSSEKEAQTHIDNEHKAEFGIVAKKGGGSTKVSKKLTKKELNLIKKKEEKERKERLTSKLEGYWQKRDGTPDDKMVKHCLKSTKYVEVGDSFVDVTDSKPTIHKEMLYDDEGDSPESNFENFENYNLSMEMPKLYKKEGRTMDGQSSNLKITPQYDGSQGFGLTHLTYENSNDREQREVTQEELDKINEGVEEVREDYKKRLKSYYKRYGDKISVKGYWKNR